MQSEHILSDNIIKILRFNKFKLFSKNINIIDLYYNLLRVQCFTQCSNSQERGQGYPNL